MSRRLRRTHLKPCHRGRHRAVAPDCAGGPRAHHAWHPPRALLPGRLVQLAARAAVARALEPPDAGAAALGRAVELRGRRAALFPPGAIVDANGIPVAVACEGAVSPGAPGVVAHLRVWRAGRTVVHRARAGRPVAGGAVELARVPALRGAAGAAVRRPAQGWQAAVGTVSDDARRQGGAVGHEALRRAQPVGPWEVHERAAPTLRARGRRHASHREADLQVEVALEGRHVPEPGLQELVLGDELLARGHFEELQGLHVPGHLLRLAARGGVVQLQAGGALRVAVADRYQVAVAAALPPEGAGLEGQGRVHRLRADVVAADLLEELRHEELARLVHPPRRAIRDDDHHPHRPSQGERLQRDRAQADHLPLDFRAQWSATIERVDPLKPRCRKYCVVPIKDEDCLLFQRR
mmetsp:Transcript_118290/g.335491  ORF Transcript_118290/g.335491 Transcript_118290/m.335491 type:complete len:409 (-) Transcript_118290:182-1408(-)